MIDNVYLNGRIIPASEAQVSVFDAGFTHAAGLFETLRVYQGRVLRLDDHVRRMLDSAATLNLALPFTLDGVRDAVMELLLANEIRDARLRIIATPGRVPRPGQADDPPAAATLLITTGPVAPHPPELYKNGMRVCIGPYKQSRLDPLAGHKTLSYLPRLLAMKHAAERKCLEALWFNTDNHLAEGSICNVFIVQDGKLRTPPVNTPILPGISRKLVLEIAAERKLPAEESPITIEELLAAQEVFLTGSVLQVMPVTTIERHVVGEGSPGERTRNFMEWYAGKIARECEITT